MFLKKSVSINGIGAFHVKKLKTSQDKLTYDVFFAPSTLWSNLGCKSNRSPIELSGVLAAESMNLSALSIQSGFTREALDCGMKDVLNSAYINLKNQSTVFLTFGNLGKFILDKKVRFIFASTIKSSINKSASKTTKLPILNSSVATISCNVNEAQVVEQRDEPTIEPTISVAPKIAEVELSLVEEEVLKTGEAVKQLQIASSRLEQIESLLDEKLCVGVNSGLTHTHHYTGDRLWKDGVCPICRTKESGYINLKEKRKLADLESDKIQLHVSLQIDNEYFHKKKAEEEHKRKVAEEIAATNHQNAIQKKNANDLIEILPVGDVLDKRKVRNSSADSWQELANALKEQIIRKNENAEKIRKTNELEDTILSEALRKQIKAEQIQSHLDKLNKSKLQRDALALQINLKQKKVETEEPISNSWGRSESLMALYKKEKAKQVYLEQLAIVRQREAYAQRAAEVEKKHTIDRLVQSKKELVEDLKFLKTSRIEARKSLESYWKQQIEWKAKICRE